MIDIPAPLRLRLDTDALISNWRALDRLSGTAACGAAVKADGYGLGAADVTARLAAAGCRDFFVATWAEAAVLDPLMRDGGLSLSVLHGVRAEDMPAALALSARPVLNTPAQVARWREGAGGRPCDLMVDTGMNRLGIAAGEAAAAAKGLNVDTLLSHLACADEDSALNEVQRRGFAELCGRVDARRTSLANSAGIALGQDYAFDLTRPGIALYGGVPRAELAAHIRQVVFPEAQVIQRRRVPAGETVGYNATWTAPADTPVAIVHLGYADGYLRAFSSAGHALWRGERCCVVGRVSMDLLAVSVPAGAAEGDWLEIAYDLPQAAETSGLSQYELLTGLGHRYGRRWS